MNSEAKPKLKDCFIVLEKENVIRIGFTPGRAIKITDNIDFMKSLLEFLDGKHSIKNIAEKLGKEVEEIETVIHQLDQQNVIEDVLATTTLSDSELERYKRQLSYFSIFSKNKYNIQEKIKKSKVLLVGLGGGGSQVLISLLSLGVGHVTAIDFDEVELHNLNRQILYTEKDVGKLKVDAGKSRAEEINPHSSVKIVNERIDSLEKAREYVKDVDIVICTADGPVYYIYKWINQACVEKNIPWVSLGVLETRGFVGPFVIPRKTFCYNCIVEEKIRKNPKYLEDIEIMNAGEKIIKKHTPPSIIPTFGILGNYLVLDVLHFLTGIMDVVLADKILTFDMETMGFDFQPTSCKKKCGLCENE